MTTKQRLHQLVDELSEVEAEHALRVISARRAGDERTTLVLDDAEAQRFLDALERPEASVAGLRSLARHRA